MKFSASISLCLVLVGCASINSPPSRDTAWHAVELTVADTRVSLTLPMDEATRRAISATVITREQIEHRSPMYWIPLRIAYDQPMEARGFNIEIGAGFVPEGVEWDATIRRERREEEFWQHIARISEAVTEIHRVRENRFELVESPLGYNWDRHFHESLTPVVIDKYWLPIEPNVMLYVSATYDKEKWRDQTWFTVREQTIQEVVGSVSVSSPIDRLTPNKNPGEPGF